jgi:cytochrome c-type protein NapC
VHVSLLGIVALAIGAIAAALVLGFLLKQPKLTAPLKLLLLFGLFVLPTSSAFLGNASNMEASKSVEFCGGCHVMTSYVNDVKDPNSTTLAALHGRIKSFGAEACYGCHADYGMFGGVTTKLGGMHHVIDFYSDDWAAPGHRPPALYKPYDTGRCMNCHDPMRKGTPLEHQVHAEQIKSHEIKCTDSGCHGSPHPKWEQQVVR